MGRSDTDGVNLRGARDAVLSVDASADVTGTGAGSVGTVPRLRIHAEESAAVRSDGELRKLTEE